MAPPVLVNGAPAAAVSPLDRGLAYGDGVFRTLRVAGGRPLNWRRHYARLCADARSLSLAAPAESLLLDEMRQVAAGDAVVKVVLTRGASSRGYAFAGGEPGTRIVAAFPAPETATQAREGVRVRRCSLVLSEQPRLAGAKTLNRLENVLARGEWSDPAIAEGLLADAGERLVEGTASNVFLVKSGHVATPAMTRCGVIGAQRERVRDLLDAEGIECIVRDIAFAELLEADECFLTNSVVGVWPVAAFEAHRWAPGPVTRRIQSLVEADDGPAR